MKSKIVKVLSCAVSLALIFTTVQLPINVNAAAQQSTFAAVADTFLAQGDPGGVYSTNKFLYIRSQASQQRKSLLKFDLSSLRGKQIDSVILGLYNVLDTSVSVNQAEFGNVKVSGISDINWDPTKLNWNTMTTGINMSDISEIGTLSMPAGGPGFNAYHEMDITNYVAASDSKKFSLVLEDIEGKIFKFASNEYGNNTAPYIKVTYEDSNIPVTGVNIEQSSISVKTGDAPVTLNWSLSPSYATNQNVTWTSSNQNVATVDNGVVTPVGEGSTTITVTTADGGYKDTCVVNVTLGILQSKLYSVADTYIAQGDPTSNFQNGQYLYARSTGGNTNEIYIKFDGSEIDRGSLVSASLNLYYFKDDSSQATIDASAVDGGSLPVMGLMDTNWSNATNITWNENVPGTSDALPIGNIKVDSEANGGFNKYYSVDVTDYITAKQDGVYGFTIHGDSATQKAYKFRSNEYPTTGGDLRPYLTLVYNPSGIPVTGVTIDKPQINVDTSSDDIQLNATITPYNASNQTITWASTNNNVATVTQKGLVSIVGAGSAKISATCDGKVGYSDVTVTQGKIKQKVIKAVDTFIDQGVPTTPQSTAGNLYCKNYGGGIRTSYINFDCSSYADKYITGAKLYLYYYKDSAAFTLDQGSLPVTGLMDNSWSSNVDLINYSNVAQYVNEANSVSCGNLVVGDGTENGFDKYYSVDVSNYIKAMGGNKFSFKLQGPSGVNAAYKFRSSDYADQTMVPYLVIYYNPTGIDTQSVTLDKTQLYFETGEAGATLNAKILPELASKPYVTWSSSNNSVATVDSKGFVKPVGVGSAVITATSGDGKKSATCNVKVDQALQSIKIYPTADTYADAANKDVINGTVPYVYSRSGTARNSYLKFDLSEVDTSKLYSMDLKMYYFLDTSSQATIDVSALNGGSLPVYGISNNTWDEATLTYNTVKPDANPADVHFIDNLIVDSQANGGFDKYYSVNVMPFAITSSDGFATFRIDGDPANINKAYKFYSSNYTNADMRPYIEVKYAPIGVKVSGVSLDRSNLVMDSVSTPVRLNARLNPKYPTNPNVTWTSSNESVATVTSSGVVTPVSAGTANITVKTQDGGFTAVCNVTVVEAQSLHRLAITNDTYVNAPGTGSQSQMFNTSPVLYLKADPTMNQTRVAYMKSADYSTYDKSKIQNAQLYITRKQGTLETSEESTISIYGITNNWEDTVTWLDQPLASGTPTADNATLIGQITIPAGLKYDETYSVDITEFLKNNSQNIASFLLVSDSKPYYFHSIEASNPDFRPYISIQMVGEAVLKCNYSYGTNTGWVAGGNLTADVTVPKSAISTLSNVTVVCAIYHQADGMLSGLVMKTVPVSQSGDTNLSLTYQNLPGNASDYYVKIIALKDKASLSPVTNYSILLN